MMIENDKQVIDIIREFIKENRISEGEQFYQCDWINEQLPQKMHEICELVGYYKYEDE